ncbi:MAG: UDP-N-acetylglucosamine 1-carboxyvinyltransferase, partial [Patescibacteria group bacterium]
MKFIIRGGRKLEGEIKLAGAKNAATKMMVASLLTSEPCVLENFPQIGDTEITSELCRSIGSKIQKDGGTLKIHTPAIANTRVVSLSRRNRIPILAIGPLLARVGEAEVPILGGDKIGPRPVDIHLDALKAMGAKIEIRPESYFATAKTGLRGAEITLRFPSVGATENAILAAALAKGKTVINNAAIEPEILDLIKMLQNMGAIIGLGVNRTVIIDGVKELRGAVHRILPDRNEAVSFACLAAATGGRILAKGARQEDLVNFLNVLRRIGGEYEAVEDGIIFYSPSPNTPGVSPEMKARRTLRSLGEGGLGLWRIPLRYPERKLGELHFPAGKALNSAKIETAPHPGFMTDWQQPLTVLLTQASGQSTIHETIYEDRFGYAQDLNLMGADIKVLSECLKENNRSACRFEGQNYNHSAIINGPRKLRGANLEVRDLRSGIAHIIAALIAEGESV